MQDSRRATTLKKQKSIGLDDPKEDTNIPNQSISIADELQKLAKLREEGLLTEEEFNQMKQNLIKINRR